MDSKKEIDDINIDNTYDATEEIEDIDLDSIDLSAYPDPEEDGEEDVRIDGEDPEKVDEDFSEVGGKLLGALPYLLGGLITIVLITVIVIAIGYFAGKKKESETETGAVSASVNNISTSAQPSGNDVLYIYVSDNEGETIVYTSDYTSDYTEEGTSTETETSEEQTSSESLTVAATTTSGSGSVNTLNREFLDSADYPEILELIENYYTAYAACDLGQLLSLVDYNGGTQITQDELDERAEIVEDYVDLVCYFIEGMDANSYVVYASYGIKFYNIDTPAPTLTRFYVTTSDDGSIHIYNGEVSSKLNAYLNSVNEYDCVKELSESINVALGEACQADERLRTLMDILYGSEETEEGEVEE